MEVEHAPLVKVRFLSERRTQAQGYPAGGDRPPGWSQPGVTTPEHPESQQPAALQEAQDGPASEPGPAEGRCVQTKNCPAGCEQKNAYLETGGKQTVAGVQENSGKRLLISIKYSHMLIT